MTKETYLKRLIEDGYNESMARAVVEDTWPCVKFGLNEEYNAGLDEAEEIMQKWIPVAGLVGDRMAECIKELQEAKR